MKMAKVFPIHEDGKKDSPNNYKPISILGYLSKIFEKAIQKRLITYLEKFLMLTENQFGFTKKERYCSGFYVVVENDTMKLGH